MSGTTGRIWVTRARPGAEATAQRLIALGHDPVISPVLEVRPVETSINMDGVAALAFTSANAVRAFAAIHPDRGRPAWAVGEATARALREAGFAEVEDAGGDVEALAQLLARRAPGLVLNPTAAEPSADLGALLAQAGVPVRSAPVYETVPAAPVEAIGAIGEISAVLVHSAKAAARLTALLPSEDLVRLSFLCISQAAARPLLQAGACNVRWAAQPTEAAMLELIEPPEPGFKVLDARFWAAIAFLVLSMIAAVVVALWGPMIWPKRV